MIKNSSICLLDLRNVCAKFQVNSSINISFGDMEKKQVFLAILNLQVAPPDVQILTIMSPTLYAPMSQV